MNSFSKIKTFYIIIFAVVFFVSEFFLTIYAVQYFERLLMDQRHERNKILAQLALEAIRHVDPQKDMTEARVKLLQRLAMMRFFDDQSFLCAVDSTGFVFAHLNPSMIGMYQGDQYIDTASGRLPYIGEAYRVQGLWENPTTSTIEIVSTLYDPDSKITIAAHQNKTVVDQEIGAIRLYFIIASSLVFGVLFIIGLTVSQRIIGKHVDSIQEAEKALHEAKDAAESANRAKSDFLARMSHELRTPLNGILGYAQLMERDPRMPTVHKEGATIIQRSGEHLLDLITDILDLSKIEAQRVELRTNTFNLQESLKAISDLFTVRAQQQDLSFVFDDQIQKPIIIKSDEQKIRQVLINLLGNAVKFTEQGEIRFTAKAIQESSNEDVTTLRFEVADTGVGIAPEQLDNIFQPFSQIESNRPATEGTGLGLTISREFVSMMGGNLQVQSTPDEGTVFWFEITCPVVSDLPEAVADDSQFITGYTGARQRVIVADDTDENRSFLVNVLTPLGFEVFEAENGQQAIDIAHEKNPHLIILDIVMPVLDGYKVAQHIRENADLKDTIIIALSASAFEHNRQQSIDAGCNDFIPKPIRISTLFRAIQTYLDINWIYTDKTPGETLPQPEKTGAAAVPSLAVPPAEHLEALRSFTQMGDIQGINQQLDVILSEDNAYTDFVETLRGLTKSYEINQIRHILDTYMKKIP